MTAVPPATTFLVGIARLPARRWLTERWAHGSPAGGSCIHSKIRRWWALPGPVARVQICRDQRAEARQIRVAAEHRAPVDGGQRRPR